MIEYKFPISKPNNLQQIVSLLESKYSILMHESKILPSTRTVINGFLGIQMIPHNYFVTSLNQPFIESILHIIFFESNNYSRLDNNGNIIYQSRPLTPIPSQSEIETLISELI